MTLLSSDEACFRYGDSEESVSVTLSFAVTGSCVSCTVEARLTNHWYEASRRFDKDCGITITFTPKGYEGNLLALSQTSKWWTEPIFTMDLSAIPEKTQALLWKNKAQYGFMTAACSEVFKSEFFGAASGAFARIAHYAGGFSELRTLCFVFGLSQEPFELIESVVLSALSEAAAPAKSRKVKEYPEIFEYLGFCTWDAFYRDVTEAGILQKVEELRKLGLPVSWMILDDGWQSIDNCSLKSVVADSKKFPRGLQAVVRDLKARYGIRWAGVWHAMLGHWEGICPEGELYQSHKELFRHTPNARIIPEPDFHRAFDFFSLLHSYLADCGFDFVKVDGQSGLWDFVMDDVPIGIASREMHAALEASVGLYFHGRMINCMGMALEQIFSRPMSALSRNSDDFYPNKKHGFSIHAMTNAYNSLTHSPIYWGDWDMFWTKHSHAVHNAVLRAVSGGPVYISDPIGTTDPFVLLPLILSNGRVLRGDRPGLPTKDCLLTDPSAEPKPLKIWNIVGNAGVLAVFNINTHEAEANAVFSLSDIPGLPGGRFFVNEYFSEESFTLAAGESKIFTLPPDGMRLYRIIPIIDGFAAIGFLDKYLAPAVIRKQSRQGRRAFVALHEGGRFAFASQSAPIAAHVNGEDAVLLSENHYYIVDSSGFQGEVIIDLTF